MVRVDKSKMAQFLRSSIPVGAFFRAAIGMSARDDVAIRKLLGEAKRFHRF
jgi:hypothetical protein